MSNLLNNVFLLLRGCGYTVGIVSASILIGMLLGFVMGASMSRYSSWRVASFFGRAYVNVVRGTPLFIQILILYFGLPQISGLYFSPLTTGIIALGLNSAAYLAESLRGGINSISIGQWEVAKVLGYTPLQIFRYILFPQVIRVVLPSLTNEIIALIKESSILMVIGIPEITKVSRDIVARELNPMEVYSCTALLYLALTVSCSYLSRLLERRFFCEC